MVALVHSGRRMKERTRYIAMVESLSSESARRMMLSMLAAEIDWRVQALSTLASNGGPAKSEGTRLNQ